MALLPLFMFTLLIAGARSGAGKWDPEASSRKADYLYLEAQNQALTGNPDAAFELLDRAASLNSSDPAIGYSLALFQLSLANTDSMYIHRALSGFRNYYRMNPDDYDRAAVYAQVLGMVGLTDEALAVAEETYRRAPDDPSHVIHLLKMLDQKGDSASLRRSVGLIDTVIEAGIYNDQSLILHKIKLLFFLGDSVPVEKEIHTLIDRGHQSSDPEWLVLASQAYSAMNRDSDALSVLNRAVEMDSANGLVLYALGQQYLAMGDSAQYERNTYSAMRMESLEPEVKAQLLQEYIVRHMEDSTHHERIASLLSTLEQQHPHEFTIHDLYARYLVYINDFNGAEEQEQLALDIDPAHEDKWLALIGLQIHNKHKALETADKALRYFPRSKDLYLQKAYCLSETGAPASDVFAAVDSALACVPATDTDALSEIYTFKGDMMQRVGDKALCDSIYSLALMYNPDNALALNNFAYFLAVQRRDLDKAQEMAERSLLIKPADIHTVDTYAWVMFQKGDYPRAREIFDSAIDSILSADDVSAEGFDHAGDIYFMTGDHDKAVEFWNQALKLEPDNATIRRKAVNRAYFAP